MDKNYAPADEAAARRGLTRLRPGPELTEDAHGAYASGRPASKGTDGRGRGIPSRSRRACGCRAPNARPGDEPVRTRPVAEWPGGTGFPQKSSGSAPVIAEGTAMSTTTRRSDARRLTKDLSRAGVGATRALHRSETRVEHDVSPRRGWDHGQRIE
jgi:hypothetical protein